MKRWLVFDTETTGLLKPVAAKLEEQPEIIELALLEICVPGREDDAFEPRYGESFVRLIKPKKPVDDEITKITGLTNEDLAGASRFAEILPDLEEFCLGAYGLIAHNLEFDLGMLSNELRRLGREFKFPYPPRQVCTVGEFMHLKGRRMRLIELYKHSTGKEYPQTHRALDDVKALAEICMKEGVCAG